MSVSDITIVRKDRKSATTVSFDQFSRTAIAIAQMIADGLILTTLSFLSLVFVIFMQRHDGIHYYLYLFPTIGACVTLVFSFACSGIYDVLNVFDRISVLRSTVKRLLEVILLLTGCFFVLKVSDDFSRVWLATWSITSAIALCGFRLITARAVKGLVRSGRLTQNVAIVG